MRILLLLIGLIVLCAGTADLPSATGLPATLSITVKDNINRQVLAGAAIIVEPGSYQGVTDDSGKIVFRSIAPGISTIRARLAEYMDTYEPVNIISGQSNEVEMLMAELDPPPSTQGLPPRAIPYSLGVNVHTHYLFLSEIEAVSAAGFKFHRLGMDQWLIGRAPWIGYVNGQYIFGYTTDAGGDGPIATVPKWLEKGVRMLGCVEYDGVKYTGLPITDAELADWAEFCRQAAQTFKGKQIIYELSNEPIYFTHWLWGWDAKRDVPLYIRAAKVAADAIHSVDPQAIVCAPGGAFIDDYIIQGIGDVVDAYSEHLYQEGPPEANIEPYNHIKQLLAKYTHKPTPVPIINSEQGYCFLPKQDAGPNVGSDEIHAQYMVRTFLVDVMCDVRLTCWYDWNHLAGYGGAQSAPKALRAFKVLVTELNGYRFLKRLDKESDNFVLVFQKDRSRRYAAWALKPSQVQIFIGTPKAEVVSMYGDNRAIVDAPGGTITLQLDGYVKYIEPVWGTIAGSVRDTSGSGLPDATVSTKGGFYSITTDTNGNYTLSDLPAGTYDLTVSKIGYGPQTLTGINVMAGQTRTYNFTLTQNTGTVSGYVRDAINIPIGGAAVSAEPGGYSTTTNADGSYTLSYMPPGTYKVTASKLGYLYQTKPKIAVVVRRTTTCNFNLTPNMGTISGVVKDTNNNPISGAAVWAAEYSTTTDSNGNYTLTGVAAGTYNMTAAKVWHALQTQRFTVTKGQTTTCNFNLMLTAGTISGYVRDANNNPLGEAVVYAEPGGYSTTTNADGSYTLNGLPFGTYAVVIASKAGYARQIKTGISIIVEQTATCNFALSPLVLNGTNIALNAVTYLECGHDKPDSFLRYGLGALDGATQTMWSCSHNGLWTRGDHWLTYDLGSVATVTGYVVKHVSMLSKGDDTNRNTKNFIIESGNSLQGPWTEEFSVSNNNYEASNTLIYETPKRLRYVRIRTTKPSYGFAWAAQVPEFEVWGYPGPPVPIKFEAEDYDSGANAVAGTDFYDTTPGNSGDQYRTQDVDIETCSEGGYNVCSTAAGEWLKYRLKGGGVFQVSLRYAGTSSGLCHLEVDGNIIGPIYLPATGGWQSWQTVQGPIFSISSGNHIVKFVAASGGFNINYFVLTPITEPSVGR